MITPFTFPKLMPSSAWRLIALVLAVGLSLITRSLAQSVVTSTQSFTYTGANKTWPVPTGFTHRQVIATTFSTDGITTVFYSADNTATNPAVHVGSENGPLNNGSARTSLNVNADPVITTQPPSSVVTCTGSTVSISADGSGGTFQWLKNGTVLANGATGTGSTISGATTGMLTIVNPGSGDAANYSLRLTSGSSTATSNNASLTVNPVPQIASQPSSVNGVCEGASISFSVSGSSPGSASFQWYKGTKALTDGATGTGSTISGARFFTLTILNVTVDDNAADYYLKVSSSNGCSTNTNNASLSVKPAPALTLSSSGPLSCTATSVTLTATAGLTSYTFSAGATPGSPANTARVSSPGIYSVTASNGCLATATTNVTSNTITPSVGINPSSQTICQGQSVTLTASGADAYTWSTGATTASISATATGPYSVTGTASNGCTGTATAGVTVAALPIAGLTNNGPLSCTLTSVTLTASGGTSYTFTSPGGSVLTGSGNTRTVSSPGTYSVSVASANGCTSTTTTSVSSNTTAPTATLSASPSTTLTCAQTSLTLTAGGGTSYVFSPNVVSQSGNKAVVNAAGVYSVTVTNASTGCTSTTSITISQDVSMPMASLVSSGTLTCSNTSVTLTASPSGQSYRFSAGATQIGTSNQARVTSAGPYSVTVLYGNGCSSVASVSVSQNNTPPSVSISANPSLTIAPGQSTTLTANVTGGTPPFTYAWSTGSTASSIVVNTGGPYSVTATGANGCSAAASTTVTVSGPFAITGVTTLSCDPIQPNRFSLSFNPRYQGLNGSPVSFSVTNELFPTTQPGPYTLQLYSDNPTIILNAVQSGVSSSFIYNWLAACNSSTTPNTPPRVVMGIPAQTATVGTYFSYVIPDGTFTDDQTPGSLKLSATGLPPGLGFMGATLSGTPSTTLGSPFSITITATDPGNLSVSTPLMLTVLPASGTPPPTMPFAITGVTTISCTPVANRINLVFSPRYQGMSGQPIAFEVVNELAPTTDPAPYSLTLYRDNPVITLRATQTGSPGPVTFSYDWLVACMGLGQENTPPRLNEPVKPQSATVGVAYSLNLFNTFTDQETPNQITLNASALPAGLVLNGKLISGTPSMSGVTSVTLTATDGGGLSTATSFTITVQPGAATPPPNPAFSITGVTTVSCTTLSAGQRQLTFSPRYGGDNGTPISFSVVSELSPTTQPGPYTLRLYTDNPVITLSAVQSGVSSQFSYGWLAACTGSARRGAVEEVPLSVRVLGNPVPGESVEMEVRGAEGQLLRASLVDERGQAISSALVPQAGAVESLRLAVGRGAGVYLLQVSTPTKQRSLKLIKL